MSLWSPGIGRLLRRWGGAVAAGGGGGTGTALPGGGGGGADGAARSRGFHRFTRGRFTVRVVAVHVKCEQTTCEGGPLLQDRSTHPPEDPPPSHPPTHITKVCLGIVPPPLS